MKTTVISFLGPMAPSSCNATEIKNEVFISFRGIDVRKGLLSHLKKELCRRQIGFYVDEKLDRGDEISSLLRAIEESQISLVIFSKDYASSKWCLEELAKMIECMEKVKQIVLPVFFNVDPSEVRNQQGDYGYALAKHEENLKEYMLKVQNWRSALKKASQLAGYHYPTNFEDESELIDKIVEDISEKLSKFCLKESNGLVGIDQCIERIESLLKMELREILFLGIWGMGGIGKTTIVHALFDKYFHQYDGCCFLKVKEELKQHELSSLREKLIYELFEGEGLHTTGTSKARFSNSCGRRMCRKRVFVVLDDVNTSEQLKDLIGKPNCFGPGSRVIITSRDKHVLTSGGVHQIHEVEKMNDQDSLKLFCLNAFNQSQPTVESEKLSEEVVKIAQGNPLALKVLGLYFHSKSIVAWNCALSKIKKYPNKEIQSVLRFSYDGLDEVEKNAFLDIAFFFIEDDKDYVISQLDAWGFHGTSAIEVLEEKALITISNDNRIQMHDLIREMGCEIVRQESIKCPRRRSRLRDNEEVHNVLMNDWGANNLEAIQIDVSHIGDLPLTVDTFKKMPHLRFLKLYYPSHAGLSMSPSHVKRALQKVQRELTFGSNILVECESSPDAHSPILFLQKLVALHLPGCKEPMSIGSEIHIKYIYYLLIDGVSVPKEISVTPKEIRQLTIITHTRMEILNSSIGHFCKIEFHDQQFNSMPNKLVCLRSTYYLKLFKSNGQETGAWKPKLRILFDGLRYFQQISFNELCKSPELAVPQNIGSFSWCHELIFDESNMKRLPQFIIHQLKEASVYIRVYVCPGDSTIRYVFYISHFNGGM